MLPANRRQFLCLALGAGGALGLGWAGLSAPPRKRRGLPDGGEFKLIRRTSRALGTEVSISAFHRSEDAARHGVESAFNAIERVESLMSIYRPDSQLSRLNREGVLDRPHPWLLQVLRAATAMSARSDGAFDVTVQPLWRLYADARRAGRLPSAREIAAAQEQVDWRNVETTQRRVRLHGGAQITLNGIAQGFAADRAAAALRRCGVRHALINAGEIAALGAKPGGEVWCAGVQHPRRPDAYIGLASLEGRSLSTSGDYATPFSDDLKHHHIFDPHTGRSPLEFASVSVAATRAMHADALSTAVFVLGPERGLKLVQDTPDADALFVLKDGRTMATPGFPSCELSPSSV